MRVYFVLSEMSEDGGNPYGDPPEPPEWGCLCLIVVAESRSKAKYLAVQSDSTLRWYTPADWPLLSVRQIGYAEGPARVLDYRAAKPWWEMVPEEITHPVRRQAHTQEGGAA
jgi:hypothetical protein